MIATVITLITTRVPCAVLVTVGTSTQMRPGSTRSRAERSKQASGHSVYAFVPVAIPGRHISIKLARPRSKLKE